MKIFSVVNELLNSVAIVYDWKGFYKPTFRKTVTLPKDTLQKLVGNFLLEKDTLTISFCGDALCLQQNFQPAIGYQMFFSDNSNFSVREVPNAFFTLIRDAEGKVEAFQLKQGGYNVRIPKIK